MNALTWQSKRDVRAQDVPDPKIHVLPLQAAARGYEIFFQKKQDDCIKVLLTP